MVEPWNIKTDDTRESDQLPVFIIYCEDEVCEQIYLKYFESAAIKVNPISCKRSKMDHVLHAITRCFEESRMEEGPDGPRLKAGDTQVWCVFDRDSEEEPAKRPAGNISFDESIRTARARGLRVAWSNDAFELWVLLHFQDVDPSVEQNRHRSTYYGQLTTIFASLTNPNADLQRAKAHQSFSYKQDLKHARNFRSIVRPEILPRMGAAITRAQQLKAFHDEPGVPDHRRAPCTLIHELIETLIQFGGKDPR